MNTKDVKSDLDAMERAALAAKPGKWTWKQVGTFNTPGCAVLWPDTSKGGVHYRRIDSGGGMEQADADFIAAANPAVVLELIRRLREAETDARNSEGMAECMRMFRDDMIRLEIIPESVPPMFMTEAIGSEIAKRDARIKELESHVELYVAEMSAAKEAGFYSAQDLYTSYIGLSDRIAALESELVACRRDASASDVLAALRDEVKEMQEAAYTYGDYSKEAVRVALDGVIDAIDAARGKEGGAE